MSLHTADNLGPTRKVGHSVSLRLGILVFYPNRRHLNESLRISGKEMIPSDKFGNIRFWDDSKEPDWQISCGFVCDAERHSKIENDAVRVLSAPTNLALTFTFDFPGFPPKLGILGLPNAMEFERGSPIWLDQFSYVLHRVKI